VAASGIQKSARKRLTWLGGIAVTLAALIGLGILYNDPQASFVPKLALDLQGGTQIILTPQLANGQTVKPGDLAEAVSIIRQRVDGTGVAEASVTTQGNNNIIVEIPGKPSDSTLKLIQASASMQFRPVLVSSQSGPTAAVGASTDVHASASATPSITGSPIATSSAAPSNGSDLNWVSKSLQAQYEQLDCSKSFRAPGQVDDNSKPLVTCDNSRTFKYILGPVEVEGKHIADANANTVTTSTGASTGEWAVNLTFDSVGTQGFAKVTQRLYALGQAGQKPRDEFAVTLDGYVITAPSAQAVISNGQAQITGSFTAVSSKALADQLKYGSLPIGFNVQSQDNISAALGGQQLSSGLLAGLIGLIIVVFYSVLQYRGLAIITIGSLIVAAVFTYLMVSLLAWRQGYRLSLAGVTGLIVSIGITADSFIIYFERVRDELRDGRGLSAAVDQGWKRAIRTILVSDGISFLAAVVLYTLTVGTVRGFAYTLGLTTIIDILVVVLFTHPMLQLLAGVKFFASGHKWSGFDVKTMSEIAYLGRGQFRVAKEVAATKVAKSSKEAVKRQTIAERKASGEIKGDAN
jgi:preprotein translocase subunit SecD